MATGSQDQRDAHEKHQAAVDAAVAAPTKHAPRLITSHITRTAMHGGNPFRRFNNALAVLITRSVGTMWAAYLFVLIGLVSLPQAYDAFFNRGDTVTGVAWLSQSFLQLVLLPIIIVGQNVISTAQDARAMADHETLTVLHAINVQQLQLLERQEAILGELQKPR